MRGRSVIVVVASSLFGLWGLILGPHLTAMGRDLAVYFAGEWRRDGEDVAAPVEEKEDAAKDEVDK